jgi:Na+/proline symporter
MGLSAVALGGNPAMRVLSAADVSAGLAAPSAAAALLGKSGAAAILILLFLAVTSATSAELIAVSSILTYDVYKVGLRSSSRITLVVLTLRMNRNTSTLKLLRNRS